MKNWQFNVLFFVGVGGAVILLLGKQLGLQIDESPTALTGVGAILTYILTQKTVFTKHTDDEKDKGQGSGAKPSIKKRQDQKKDDSEEDTGDDE